MMRIDDIDAELLAMLETDNSLTGRIKAIKRYREIGPHEPHEVISLTDAKSYVDALAAGVGKHYTVTVTRKPLRHVYDTESEPMTRLPNLSQARAIKEFAEYCQAIDTGCVQLWEGQTEVGQMYI